MLGAQKILRIFCCIPSVGWLPRSPVDGVKTTIMHDNAYPPPLGPATILRVCKTIPCVSCAEMKANKQKIHEQRLTPTRVASGADL